VLEKIKRKLAKIGPGLIIAALVLGPGSISSISANGSVMGNKMIWLIVLCGAFMMTYTILSAKFGAVNEKSFLTHLAARYGRWLSVIIGICCFLVCAGFQGGNNIGVGMAMNAIFGGAIGLWAALFTVIAIFFLFFFKSLYKALERLMMLLIIIMIIAFFSNLAVAGPDPVSIAAGLVPSWPEQANVLGVVAIVSTSFSVFGALFQSYLVQERNWGPYEIGDSIRDSIVGISALTLISLVVMITAATVLATRGIAVKNAADMAVQLEPLLGRSAKWLFCMGLWGASFSSFIGNAVLGGTILADGIGLGHKVGNKSTKLIACAIMLIGATIALLSGGRPPVEIIILLQAVIIIAVPLTAFMIFLESNKKGVMGSQTPRWWVNILALVGFVTVCLLAANTLKSLIGRL